MSGEMNYAIDLSTFKISSLKSCFFPVMDALTKEDREKGSPYCHGSKSTNQRNKNHDEQRLFGFHES